MHLRRPRFPLALPSSIQCTVKEKIENVEANVHAAYRNKVPISTFVWI